MKIKIILILLFAINVIVYGQSNIVNDNDSTNANKVSNIQGVPWKKDNASGNIYNNPLYTNVGVGTQDPQAPLDVEGKIIADSMNVNGQITADSMRIKGLLHIGKHSLVLGQIIDDPAAPDMITTSNGYINFGRTSGFGTFDNITVAIGKEINAPDPNQYQNIKLDVEGSVNVKENDGYCIGGWLSFSEKGTTLSIGQNAGNNNPSSQNTGEGNIYIGSSTAQFNEAGKFNTFIGIGSGTNNVNGSYNVFMGNATAVMNTNGWYNTFIGHAAGNKNRNSGENVAIGRNSLHEQFFYNNNTAFSSYNVAVGNEALYFNNPTATTNGIKNTALGYQAGRANTIGVNNLFLGYQAGLSNTTGNKNTYIGDNAQATGASAASLTNATAIGAKATVTAINSMVLGSINGQNGATVDTKVAIGTTAPQNLLHINAKFFAYTQYTNNATTSTDANKGFKVGIDKFGNAQLIQNLNKSMLFYTNSGTTTERMRITYDGLIGFGTFNTYIPKRRADVYDNSGNPQFRLTYTLNAATNLGIFTDFQTTSAGHLLINPFANGVAKFVGINLIATDVLTEALDVKGNGRFRNITAGINNGIVTHETNGTLHTIPFDPENPDDVLHADGNWGPVSGGATVTAENGTWINGSGKVEFGTNALLHNTELPLGMYSLYYTGNEKTNNVYIGYPTTQAISNSKLNVYRSVTTQGGSSAVNILTDDAGVLSKPTVVGISSTAQGIPDYGKAENIAGKFTATGASYNYAGYFSAPTTDLNTNNYAILVPENGGKVAIGIDPFSSSTGYLLTVNGEAAKPSGGQWTTFSDINFKTNIASYNDGLEKLKGINPVFYEYNGIGNLPTGVQHVGIIAQDMLNIAPYTIDTVMMPLDSNSTSLSPMLTFNGDALIYMSINAIKELDKKDSLKSNKIDSLEILVSNLNATISTYENSMDSLTSLFARLEALENCVNNLPAGLCGNDTKSGSIDINSVVNITPDNSFDKKETLLEQNVPNPFTVKTTFNYSLGTKGNVELEIMTYSGQFVTTLVNSNQEEGSYSIDWNTSDIAPGIYFYTLRVDGVEWVKKAIRIK